MRSTERHLKIGLATIVLATIVVPSVALANLTIESAVTRVGIEQGRQWSGQVSVANTADEPLPLMVEVVNLERTEQGTSVPLIGQDTSVLGRTLAGWMLTVDEVTIEPNSRARVPVTIAVPQSAPPGLYLAALLFRTAPPEGAEGIVVSTATAAAFEVVVSGQGQYDVSLISFGPARRVVVGGSVPVTAVFANRGTTLASLVGTLEIVSIGDTVKASVDYGQEGAELRLFPGSEHTFSLDSDLGAGIYRAVLDMSDGTQTHEKSVLFIVLTWPLLLLLLGIIVLLFYIFRYLILNKRQMRVVAQ